jgi:hypothetical protein
VRTSLEALTLLPDSTVPLVEVRSRLRTVVPLQIEHGPELVLYWLSSAGTTPTTRTYELRQGHPARPDLAGVEVVEEQGGLLLQTSRRYLLRYNYRTGYPRPASARPSGAAGLFIRCGRRTGRS